MTSFRLVLLMTGAMAATLRAANPPSIARVWDEEILAAIRIDLPNPPVHARNLFHLSVAMYDAWAAYDPAAVGYIYHGKHTATNVDQARREAISYAAFNILWERYSLSRNAVKSLSALSARMALLRYSTFNNSRDPSTPAGVGNLVYDAVSSYYMEDGAMQSRGYQDLPAFEGGYESSNFPLPIAVAGTIAENVNRWQPLAITDATSQNEIPVDSIQKFLGSQWKGVRPFALKRRDPSQLWIDPGPPPQLGGATDAQFRSEVVDVIRRSSELTPDDGVVMDISPGAYGNNSLGTNDGTGHPLNPATGQPYAANLVNRGDFARVLAEFWADGPQSETPPGHWNVLANGVADHPSFVKRIGGTGPVLDDLEWDVKMYFALNAALHDAACTAWSIKRQYDGWRPITAIRYMAQFGQSSRPQGVKYDPRGLPLIPGLIEVTTTSTVKFGQRHFGLPIGAVVILAWPGQPSSAATDHSGVHWIEATTWMPYQKRTFVTPAFPGYISGHSTFSRAAAEVLTSLTGSPFFPGGLGTFTAPAQTFLSFERGPAKTVQLQWGTYFDAADQAGLSRLWGGIHVSVDDLTGRKAGAQCGKAAWDLARRYFDGSILQTPAPTLTIRPYGGSQCELSFDTLRGFYYRIQSTLDMGRPFPDDPLGFVQALDSVTYRIDSGGSACKFYRVTSALLPGTPGQ